MCFYFKLTKEATSLESRFNAKFEGKEQYTPSDFNGFTFPRTPVITNKSANTIELLQWGLVPAWAKDLSIRQYTLNARLETIHSKPAFKNYVKNKCLVIADGFFEWKWLDPKGKNKQKYLITLENDDLFTFAGLWCEWVDRQTGEIIKTYTILTTEANELMSEIHNSKKRMPAILTLDNAFRWLTDESDVDFRQVALRAEPV